MADALIVRSQVHDPWSNLALEEYLVEQLAAAQPADGGDARADALQAILYLWQNDNTVVIGRNQNAWAECLPGQLEAEGGRLARRSTGGGAVYHDLGNLNFSLILPRRQFDLDQNFAMIVDAVASQGIAAERSGRNDILTDGRKFSGNAFSLRRTVGLHHGTLLVHSDYARVARYLTVSPAKLQARGVSSVRSRITNLQAVNPSISVASLEQALERSFIDHFCATSANSPDGGSIHIIRESSGKYDQLDRLLELRDHYASWTWRYGESLRFDAQLEQKLDWGLIQMGFQIDKGLVRRAQVYTDALDSDFISLLPDVFTYCRFHSADLAAALRQLPDSGDNFGVSRRQMVDDIVSLLLEQKW